jgi:hypothetical protein
MFVNSSSSTFTTSLIDTNVLNFGEKSQSSNSFEGSSNLDALFQRSSKKKN